MLDEFFRITYKRDSFTTITRKAIFEHPAWDSVYRAGVLAYVKGTCFQDCPEIRDSVEEHIWQKGWDDEATGNVSSIASFDKVS